jgi:hypothetical protein
MKSDIGVQGALAESKQDLKAQLAQYVEHQPESTLKFHRWMKRLEVASLAIVVGVFAVAMYVSINWKTVPLTVIPSAWFCFPISFTPFAILVGLHAIVLRVFPPTTLPLFSSIFLPGVPRGAMPRKKQQLLVERQAVAWGWGFIVMALVVATFWGTFIWAVWTFNMAMLEPLINILGVVLGAGISIQILYTIFKKISKSG